MKKENTIQEQVEEFEKKLDVWLKSKEHLYQCIGYSEAQSCCLDKSEGDEIYGFLGRKKLIKILIKALKAERERIAGEVKGRIPLLYEYGIDIKTQGRYKNEMFADGYTRGKHHVADIVFSLLKED